MKSKAFRHWFLMSHHRLIRQTMTTGRIGGSQTSTAGLAVASIASTAIMITTSRVVLVVLSLPANALIFAQERGEWESTHSRASSVVSDY